MSASAYRLRWWSSEAKNKTEKSKDMSERGGNTAIKRAGESHREGRELGGGRGGVWWAALYSHSDMRLMRLLIQMSPTSSSCEPNYISNSI